MSGTSKWPMSELNSALRRAPIGIGLAVEGPRVGRVVGLAAEVEARHEQVAEVLLLLDLAAEVVVEVLDAAGARASWSRPPAPRRGAPPRPPPGCRTSARAPAACARSSLLGFVFSMRLPVALLPVADEVGVEHAGPAHAALEEGEVQVGEAPGDAAEEDGLGHGVAGGGEVADVVVAEVRRRVAQQDRARAVVEARRQLAARGTCAHTGS